MNNVLADNPLARITPTVVEKLEQTNPHSHADKGARCFEDNDQIDGDSL